MKKFLIRVAVWIAAACMAAALVSCTDGSEFAQATCVLTDTSGTYADRRGEVDQIIRARLLPRLLPGDSVVMVRIDGESYEDNNVEQRMTLDARPSFANRQVRQFAELMSAQGKEVRPSRHTDIGGAMMLCADHLRESSAGTKAMVAFSDMEEDLPRGVQRTLGPDELAGVSVFAVNVKRLDGDQRNPTRYRRRLEKWGERVRQGGAADWQVVLEPETLVAALDAMR